MVENRYADVTKVSGPGRIADDVLQAACIVGTEVKDWQKVDFAGLKGRSGSRARRSAPVRAPTSWAAR